MTDAMTRQLGTRDITATFSLIDRAYMCALGNVLVWSNVPVVATARMQVETMGVRALRQ